MVVIVIVATALRVLLLLAGPIQEPKRANASDTGRYVELADNLLSKGRFALAGEEHPGNDIYPFYMMRLARGEEAPLIDGMRAEVVRTPGYPLILAAVDAMGMPSTALLVVQCLMSLAMVVGVYALAVWLFRSPSLGCIAAAILAVHPADIVSANYLLTETPFAFLLMLGVGCFLLALRGKQRIWLVALGGLVLGLATMVRPVGMLLGVALGLWVVVFFRSKKAIIAGLVVAIASLTPSALWAARNARAGYGFAVTNLSTVHVARTVAFMAMREAGETRYPQGYEPYRSAVVDEIAGQIQPGETVDSATKRIARQKIMDKPGLYCALMTDLAAKFMFDHSVPLMYRLLGLTYQPTGLRDRLLAGDWSVAKEVRVRELIVPILWTVWNVALGGCLLLSLVRMAKRSQWALLTLVGGVLFYFIFASQYHGCERMRVPILWLQALAVAWLVVPTPWALDRRQKPKAAEIISDHPSGAPNGVGTKG
ncbi:MAG: phospholipid carrier-dependent glycosyltransferase [Planctomycetes bacterium]|nr:phospholipid carrier-dependent glycosyltransferase [Planctomycetota bacterium]